MKKRTILTTRLDTIRFFRSGTDVVKVKDLNLNDKGLEIHAEGPLVKIHINITVKKDEITMSGDCYIDETQYVNEEE